MCIWMLDTNINPEERATRSLNVQFEENKKQRTFLRKDLARNPASAPEITPLIEIADENETRLRRQAQQLSIKEKRDKREKHLGFGDGPKSIADRIEATLNDTLFDYSLLSPQAHGDTWAILVLSTQTKSFNPTHVISDLSPLHALSQINDSWHLLAKGLRKYYDLYGYDIDEYSKMLEPNRERMRQASLAIIGSTNQSN